MGLLRYLTNKTLKELPLFYASAYSLVTMKPTRSPDLEEIQCVLTARVMALFSPLPSWMFYRWSLGLSEPRDGKAAILEGKKKESVAEEWLVTEQLMGRFCMGCKWGFLKPGPPLAVEQRGALDQEKGLCPALLSFLRRETLSCTGSCSQTLHYSLVCVWHAQGFVFQCLIVMASLFTLTRILP